MKRTLTGLMVLAAALVALASCSTPPPAPKGDKIPYKDYPSITAAEGLHNFLVINGANAYEEGGLLHTLVEARWTGRRYVYLEYRYLFRDRNGRVLNNDAAWRRAYAAPGTRVQLAGNAISPDAVDWNLEIRRQID